MLLIINRHCLENIEEELNLSKQAGHHHLVIIIALLLALCIFSYGVGDFDLREDEFHVVDAAAGYYHLGDFYSWDWLQQKPGKNYLGATYYDRAFPHTVLIAQAYRTFGISEWSSRLISVIFGLFYCLLIYLLAGYFTANRNLALLAVFMAMLYSPYIFIFRYTRMYALLIPISLALVYSIYRSMNEKSLESNSQNQLYRFFKQRLNYNYYFIALSLALLWLGYNIHINILVLLPAAFIFVLLSFYRTREQKYLNLIMVGTVSCILIALAYYFGLIRSLGFMAFFKQQNYDYLLFLADYPFPWEVGVVMLCLGPVALVLLKGEIKNRLIYFYTIICFALVFFIFIADRFSHFLYTSHITPLAMILILFNTFLVIRASDFKFANYIFAFLILLFSATHFFQNVDRIYGDNHNYGSFSVAYQVMVDNYDPHGEVIFGQYLRSFYLQDLANQGVQTVNMLNRERYTLEQFTTALKEYEAGWITWESRKHYHLRPEIVDYIEKRFVKLHGKGVDQTGVEIFYFSPRVDYSIDEYLKDSNEH